MVFVEEDGGRKEWLLNLEDTDCCQMFFLPKLGFSSGKVFKVGSSCNDSYSSCYAGPSLKSMLLH